MVQGPSSLVFIFSHLGDSFREATKKNPIKYNSYTTPPLQSSVSRAWCVLHNSCLPRLETFHYTTQVSISPASRLHCSPWPLQPLDFLVSCSSQGQAQVRGRWGTMALQPSDPWGSQWAETEAEQTCSVTYRIRTSTQSYSCSRVTVCSLSLPMDNSQFPQEQESWLLQFSSSFKNTRSTMAPLQVFVE